MDKNLRQELTWLDVDEQNAMKLVSRIGLIKSLIENGDFERARVNQIFAMCELESIEKGMSALRDFLRGKGVVDEVEEP